MKTSQRRYEVLRMVGMAVVLPVLFGAKGNGCPGPVGADAGTPSDDAGACVSPAGGPCGGNTSHPCECASGLLCVPADGGPPFGDVGGTCQARGDGGDGSVGDDAGADATSGVPDAAGDAPDGDAAPCVATQGGHCGGNTAHPCRCAPGLVCTPADGGPPFGDVGGTCEPPPGDAGLRCEIRASDYSSSCTVDADCVLVAQGNVCATPSCWCPSAAISTVALPAYRADVAGRAKNVCFCTIAGTPRCVAGACQVQSAP